MSTSSADVAGANGSRRKRFLATVATIVLAIAALVVTYWFLFVRGSISTDNAYVNGNLVQVTAQTGGTIVSVDADETETVTAGATLASALAATAEAGQNLAANEARIEGSVVATNPAVLQAAAELKEAYIALARTRILAPASGLVARRTAQLGARIQPGQVLATIVPLNEIWVDANFKEAQLRDIKVGQPVTLEADLYGGSVEYHGTISGLGAGTGSAFSVLPAQNATGNWIKVVQRVPVRIALDPAELAAHPLLIGLSMSVRVETIDTPGAVATPPTPPATTARYRTAVYDDIEAQAEQQVQTVIAANLDNRQARARPAASPAGRTASAN